MEAESEPQTQDTETSVPATSLLSTEPKANWFVISSRSGHEKKVAQQVEQRVKANGMEDEILQVYVPTQEKIIAKEGKKRTTEEKILPGYILILMYLNDSTWHLIRNTEGVTGFVGQTANKKVEPLSESEIAAIMAFSEVKQTSYKSSFRVGDPVKVINGPFKDFIGEVQEINEGKGQLTVLISMFGREVPTHLDFLEVTNLSNT